LYGFCDWFYFVNNLLFCQMYFLDVDDGNDDDDSNPENEDENEDAASEKKLVS